MNFWVYGNCLTHNCLIRQLPYMAIVGLGNRQGNRINIMSRRQDFIIQDISMSYRDLFEILGTYETAMVLEICHFQLQLQ